MSHHTIVRMVFIFILLIFAFQTGARLVMDEIYPALMAPIFPGEPIEDGVVARENFDIVVFTEDGSTERLDGSEIFEEIRMSSIYVAQNVFGVGSRSEAPLPRRWLRQRLDSVLPNARVQAVEFRWSRVTYSATSDPEFIEREHFGTTRVDL